MRVHPGWGVAVVGLLASTGLGRAADTVLFADAFDGYPEGSSGSPLWRVESGRWEVTADGFLGSNCGGHFTAVGARTGRKDWRDYRLSLQLKLVSRGDDWRDGPWLGFRYLDSRNAYTLGFYSRMTALHKVSKGMATADGSELAATATTIKDDTWHAVVVEVRGRRIRVELDGKELLAVEDRDANRSPALTAGNIVLAARRYGEQGPDTRVLFRDVKVEAFGQAPASSRYTTEDALRLAGPQVGLLSFMMQRRSRRWQRVPRKVLAFYYTWYGTPEIHGRWVHWDKVNPEEHDIASSTHYPAKGAYDSHDPKIIDDHIRMAKDAGLDGFICTWWGRGAFDDVAFRKVLDIAARNRFEVTVYWETAPGKGREQIDQAVDDLVYLVGEYGGHPAFLKVEGKPVFFVYGRVMGQVPMKSWPDIISEARKRAGKDFLLIADGYREAYARVFDGIHVYNIAGACGGGKQVDEIRAFASESFPGAVATARKRGAVSCITIIPGYDDTKIRTPGLKAERWDGATYRVLWEEAAKADPDWILITSWNEWHEGSEIEPSWEDGDQYIRLTARCAPRFKRTPHSTAPVPEAGGGVPDEMARELRTAFSGVKVGLLPDVSGEAAFWLAETGVAYEELSWPDVADPELLNSRRLPVLLNSSGEHYVQSLRKDGDVDAALIRYLGDGGLLIACCSQPFPFYYNEQGKGIANAAAFGIPIAGSAALGRSDTLEGSQVRGWERPPEGRELTFTIDQSRLPSLPARIPFPASGDLRWRPCVPVGLGEGDEYLALARLVDADGTSYGDGMVYIERRSSAPKGGKTLYVWMRMPDILGKDRAFSELFRFAASKMTRR